MANSDIALQVTAKGIGPGPLRTRPKVFFLQSIDIEGLEPGDVPLDDLVIKLNKRPKRVRTYESFSDFQAIQALSQGATSSIYFQSKYEAVTATSGTQALDATKYIHEVNAGNGGGVVLPDPFYRKVLVVFNTTTGSITITGRGTTSPIDGSTAALTILAGKRKHFAAPVIPTTAGTTAGWQTAT